jgi:hypothetical protein
MMAITLQDGVAFIAFYPGEDNTVSVAGFCPDTYPEDHIVRSAYAAVATYMQNLFVKADEATRDELKAEGADVNKIMSEVTIDRPVPASGEQRTDH